MDSPPYPLIEHHGVIGNLGTVALVALDGTIDFLSFPRFDSPTIFASLVDARKGGRFALAPVFNDNRLRQLYLPDSNILLTRFLSGEGVAEVSDFMPVGHDGMPGHEPIHQLVRRAKCVRGEVRFRMTCEPRFDYGRAHHKVEVRNDHEVLFLSEAPDGLVLRLRSEVPLKVENGVASAEFTLAAGKKAYFVLEKVEPGVESACTGEDYVRGAFVQTLNFWRRWLARSTYRGRWREMVDRSALVLKMLTSQQFGSIVAAPTFGLPEAIGEGRNWDYRYTWVRDASFTLYGLSRLGFHEEARAFMDWIEARCDQMPAGGALQIMYGLDGRAQLTEEILGHLEGYRGSSPVRVGNAAYGQLQLDIYGELMDSVYLYDKYGSPMSHDLWRNLSRLIDWVEQNWQRPDEGIWEVRGGQQEFLYSRLMCWVAVDRGVRLALKRGLPAPLDRWAKTRNAIYHDIFANFWHEESRTFVQAKGNRLLDAASLLMPMVKFISPTDRRWLSTLRAIERELTDDSLVYRYRGEDGLSGTEGSFCMCSFWFIECQARSGDVQKARFLFEKMLGYANHVGLYAEELGAAGEHLGNFPQAFTHLALISAAYQLDRQLDRTPGGDHADLDGHVTD